MPIPDAPATAGPYNTDGITTTFPFAYKSFGVGYHAVVKNTLGELEQLVYGVDFSVTQNANQETSPGGNVLISPALPSGSTISIYSNVPYDQPIDLPLGGGFNSAVIRDAFDRIVTLLKQADLASSGGVLLPSDRSLRVPSGESINAFPDAATRAGDFVKFDGSGNASTVDLASVAVTLDGSGNPIANLPMGGFKHTSAADADEAGQYLVWGQPSAQLDSVGVGDAAVAGVSAYVKAISTASPLRLAQTDESGAVPLILGQNTTAGGAAQFNVLHSGANVFIGNSRSDSGTLDLFTNSTSRISISFAGNVLHTLQTSPPALAVARQMVFNLTSDTNLRISVRGSDGVTRVGNITLA
jgi:hypothetical protein